MNWNGRNLVVQKHAEVQVSRFNEAPGPSRQAMQADGASENFNLFIPNANVEEWVAETNHYAKECEQREPWNC